MRAYYCSLCDGRATHLVYLKETKGLPGLSVWHSEGGAHLQCERHSSRTETDVNFKAVPIDSGFAKAWLVLMMLNGKKPGRMNPENLDDLGV